MLSRCTVLAGRCARGLVSCLFPGLRFIKQEGREQAVPVAGEKNGIAAIFTYFHVCKGCKE